MLFIDFFTIRQHQEVCNIDFCNIRISPEKCATFCFATIGKLPEIHATFVCNKNVAKNKSLRHFSNVAKKSQCCKKKTYASYPRACESESESESEVKVKVKWKWSETKKVLWFFFFIEINFRWKKYIQFSKICEKLFSIGKKSDFKFQNRGYLMIQKGSLIFFFYRNKL